MAPTGRHGQGRSSCWAGTYSHILVGRHKYGNYLYILNHDVGCELSDIFWKEEKIGSLMRKADAVTVAIGRHPVLRWMMDRIFIRADLAGNIKPDKEKPTEKIDGAVAAIMALDWAARHGGNTGSVYDERGILRF